MHGRGVERIVAGGDAQEAGALLERLGAEPRHVLQRLARPERRRCASRWETMLWASAWPMPETRASSGADAVLRSTPTRVDAVLDHGVERARQLELAEIVLVLADADRLRIDLHQLGQRILQPARDRHRAAQGHVEAGQLLRRIGRGRIDRRAGLRHHDLRAACSSGSRFISSVASLSVSREAVPLPIAISST